MDVVEAAGNVVAYLPDSSFGDETVLIVDCCGALAFPSYRWRAAIVGSDGAFQTEPQARIAHDVPLPFARQRQSQVTARGPATKLRLAVKETVLLPRSDEKQEVQSVVAFGRRMTASAFARVAFRLRRCSRRRRRRRGRGRRGLPQQRVLKPLHGVHLGHGPFPVLHPSKLPPRAFDGVQPPIPLLRPDLVNVREGAAPQNAEVVEVGERDQGVRGRFRRFRGGGFGSVPRQRVRRRFAAIVAVSLEAYGRFPRIGQGRRRYSFGGSLLLRFLLLQGTEHARIASPSHLSRPLVGSIFGQRIVTGILPLLHHGGERG
mmetsp:Transcript_12017/g.21592  ORF Transcript_12017/g.21592 Transcript_12017/m.21592 type:complete len:317 (+) Transcript_12017:885-1835(+)